MDIQTRKLNIIAYLAQLQDENLIQIIENFILNKNADVEEINPFTVEELISRIEKSEQDYKNGNFKTQDELEKLSYW